MYGQSLLHFGISLPLFGLVFFNLLPRVRREDFQQKIFKVRNDLFEEVWSNDFSFEDPAYREVRDILNGAIRWAESFRVPTFLFIVLMSKCAPHVFSSSQVSKKQGLQHLVHDAKAKLARHFMWYLWASPWGAVLMPVLGLFAMVVVVADGLIDTSKRATAHAAAVFRKTYTKPAYVFINESKRIGSRRPHPSVSQSNQHLLRHA